MSGTKESAKASAKTTKVLYGDNYHAIIGAKGGSKKTKKLKGFAYMAVHNPDRLKEVGSKGGQVKKRY